MAQTAPKDNIKVIKNVCVKRDITISSFVLSCQLANWRPSQSEGTTLTIGTGGTENPIKSQEQLYDVTEAIMTTLGKNRRLLNDSGADPIAYTLTTLDVPYNIRTTSSSLKAHNVIIRPEIIVNLRS